MYAFCAGKNTTTNEKKGSPDETLVLHSLTRTVKANKPLVQDNAMLSCEGRRTKSALGSGLPQCRLTPRCLGLLQRLFAATAAGNSQQQNACCSDLLHGRLEWRAFLGMPVQVGKVDLK
ncbi:hypothetical protein GJ744_010834 [Endocarpon pusillum]|uniref:Uncharacterized protein n=1 Tax=Endocarpon pusillum TaxID=364733 RepID=A0A8H7AFX5_9EURO|nr:hypothetical protein GJ744_010834 [Endocarpon pusillum]